MKRFAPLLAAALATALALPPAAAAFEAGAPEVMVRLRQNYMEGRYWTNGTPLTATLRNRAGEFKGQCTVTPSTWNQGYGSLPGSWGCNFSYALPAAGSLPLPKIRPGDTISIEQGAVTETSPHLGDVAITEIHSRLDTVSGVTTPAKRTSFIRVHPNGRPTLTGWVNDPPFERTGKIAGDGSFTLDVSGIGELRRGDYAYAGYVTGVFRVVTDVRVPNLDIRLGQPNFWFNGQEGAAYTLELIDRTGQVISEMTETRYVKAAAAPAAVGAPPVSQSSRFSFLRPDGRPIPIRTGHTIRVIGMGGFTLTVPRLQVEFLDTGLAVDTVRNHLFEATGWAPGFGQGGYGETDATGHGVLALPFAPMQAWARINFGGNWITTERIKTP